LDDKAMIRAVQRGQSKYLNDIAEKYYDDIYRFCSYLTGTREDSYDLTQETFLRFIKYVEHYKYRNLKGYLLTIARNVCIDYQKEKGRFSYQNVDLQEIAMSEAADKASDEMSARIERESLYAALKALPDFQREAIILFYVEELKLKEIAAVTGTGLSTVKSRIRQGTEKLRKLMQEGDSL